jgi:hypothetical protein
MTSINNSLLKFPSGLKLYILNSGKRLDGIVLRHEISSSEQERKDRGLSHISYPVFDVTASDAEKNREGMVPNYLLNYFRRHHVIKSEGGYMTYSCNEMYIPNLLAVLFVAEGARKGQSLQELLDEKMSIEGLGARDLLAPGNTPPPEGGGSPVCKTELTLAERLTTHFAKEKAPSLNTVHYPTEAAPVRVSDRIAAIEARTSNSSSSSASVEPIVVVRANLTAFPTPCRLCKIPSTFFVDTGGDWDCINCINCVKCASLTTEQRTLLERLGPDPIVKVNDSFPLKHHPFVGLYKNGIECCACHKMCTLAFDRLFDRPWSYCADCAGFEIVQRSPVATVATVEPTVEPITTAATTVKNSEVLDKLRAKRRAQAIELKELRLISIATVRCKQLQGRIDHRKSLISSSAEDLKKKEQALTEELAALEKIATEVRAIRELEKRVIEARKILDEPECK